MTTVMTSHRWQYSCRICKSISDQPIAIFMAKHAHGITPKFLPDCEIVKHRDGKSVTIKLPPGEKFFLKDNEGGDQKGRSIRIWITGIDYGFSSHTATEVDKR